MIDLLQCSLGMELGSTRIKAVLIDAAHTPLAQGDFTWENRLQDGIWTYPLEEVRQGVQAAYAALAADVQAKHGMALPAVGCIGISAMMHGYLAFDENWNLLVPFRTWRNTMTATAAAELTAAFGFNIPQRWSVAHLYQAMLNREPHLGKIAHITTLAGYLHFLLTGVNALGVGDASGIFPIDSATGQYDAAMLEKFNAMAAKQGYPFDLRALLPAVLPAGADAGTLTETGARLLDSTDVLQPGVSFCPPEGDAGTGMAATNSVAPRTGNVSAGTSIFAMVVLEKPLSRVYPEIDMVTTPDGTAVAMVHCNNCTSDLNAWVNLLAESAALCGATPDKAALYETLFRLSLLGSADCGGIFKTPGVAQRYLAAAAGVPVTCMDTAGEGGPYGMALLAAYRLHRRDGETLADYLQTRVFAQAVGETVTPSPADRDGFAAFLAQYKTALQAERALFV